MNGSPASSWPPPPGFPTPDSSRPKSWFQRNMKWFLPTLVVGCLLLIGGFVLGIFLFVHAIFASSDPYKSALRKANASPQMAAKIGTPVHVGWLIAGNYNAAGPTGNASFNIPISGPKGKGWSVGVAKEGASNWTFERLEVDVEGEDA